MPHSQGLSQSSLSPCLMFLSIYGFYSVKLLVSCQTPKLKDYSWSAVLTAYSIYSQLTSISGGLLPHPQPEGMHHAVVTGTRGLKWYMTLFLLIQVIILRVLPGIKFRHCYSYSHLLITVPWKHFNIWLCIYNWSSWFISNIIVNNFCSCV